MSGVPYGGILNYGKHKELVAYTLDEFDRLKKEYHLSKKKDNLFVIYTHYWDVLENNKTREILKRIVSYALVDGTELVKVTDCF